MVWVAPVAAQEGSSKSMELVRDAAKSNKKALIAVNYQSRVLLYMKHST